MKSEEQFLERINLEIEMLDNDPNKNQFMSGCLYGIAWCKERFLSYTKPNTNDTEGTNSKEQ